MKRLLFSLVVLASCQTTHPTDMSIDQHEQIAASERTKARAEAGKYDAGAATTTMTQDAYGGPRFQTYNPTERYLAAAAHHRKLALAHEKAAASLAIFEDAACKPFPAEVRAACPLLGSLASVERVDGGAKVKLVDAGETDAVAAHIKCHEAFGDAHGDQAVAGCPLYIRGLDVDAKNGVLVFKVQHKEDEARLMQLLNEHLSTANAGE